MFVCLFAKGWQSGGQAIHPGESPAGEGKESLRRRSQSEGNFPKTHREMRRGGWGGRRHGRPRPKTPEKVAHLRNVHLPTGGRGESTIATAKSSVPPGIVGERLPDDTCNIDEEKLQGSINPQRWKTLKV